MDRFKDLAKRGWHPEKDSGQTGGIKDHVKGWVGKGDSQPTTHYSPPHEKKDPSSFPPPPPTKRYQPGEVPAAPPPRKEQRALPPRGEAAAEDTVSKESRPFVPGTTQIDAQKFPKPPPRNTGVVSPQASITAKSKPALPPRSPPAGSHIPTTSPATVLNQGAVDRLGGRGISIPAFGIGGARGPPPPVPPRSTDGPASTIAPAPSTGTTWTEKQTALKTANNLRTNPGNVSLSEIRSAASTAKNFQDRHGEQVLTGLSTAQQIEQKYGLAGKMAGLSVGAAGKPPPPAPPPKKFHGEAPAIPLSSKPKP